MATKNGWPNWRMEFEAWMEQLSPQEQEMVFAEMCEMLDHGISAVGTVPRPAPAFRRRRR